MDGLSAFAIFCEDVRREASGKTTLIGVMSDSIVIPSTPGSIRRLTVYVRIRLAVGMKFDKPISLEMELSDGVVIDESREPMPAEMISRTLARAEERGLPFATVVGRMQVEEPVQIPSPQKMTAFLKYGDEREICGFLNIMEAPKSSSNESLPQITQSEGEVTP